jgi:hypothetical protein
MRLLCFCCKSLVDFLYLAQWLLTGWSEVAGGLVRGCLLFFHRQYSGDLTGQVLEMAQLRRASQSSTAWGRPAPVFTLANVQFGQELPSGEAGRNGRFRLVADVALPSPYTNRYHRSGRLTLASRRVSTVLSSP